jgi:hypothetical protein
VIVHESPPSRARIERVSWCRLRQEMVLGSKRCAEGEAGQTLLHSRRSVAEDKQMKCEDEVGLRELELELLWSACGIVVIVKASAAWRIGACLRIEACLHACRRAGKRTLVGAQCTVKRSREDLWRPNATDRAGGAAMRSQHVTSLEPRASRCRWLLLRFLTSYALIPLSSPVLHGLFLCSPLLSFSRLISLALCRQSSNQVRLAPRSSAAIRKLTCERQSLSSQSSSQGCDIISLCI